MIWCKEDQWSYSDNIIILVNSLIIRVMISSNNPFNLNKRKMLHFEIILWSKNKSEGDKETYFEFLQKPQNCFMFPLVEFYCWKYVF